MVALPMVTARVFPRRTRASPDDALAFFGSPGLFPPEVDRVEVSVTFTWDLPTAERLLLEWRRIAPVTIGGPALGLPSGEFEPGRYLRHGYVITSRGCPNRCWFCSVWRREPTLRELAIKEGSNVLDDNLLACSEGHVRAVFDMLGRQRAVQLTGGLEAARLRDWHVDLLARLRPKQVFLAYDTEDDYEPLRVAAGKLCKAGLVDPSKRVRAYVLIGFPGDTIEAAETRLKRTFVLGVWPMAMTYRGEDGRRVGGEWARLQKYWTRPAYIRHAAEEGIR